MLQLKAGYIDARPFTAYSQISCDALPDHTNGSKLGDDRAGSQGPLERSFSDVPVRFLHLRCTHAVWNQKSAITVAPGAANVGVTTQANGCGAFP